MRFGIDLGGTKIEASVLGADDGERLRRRTASPRDGYRATVAAIATLVAEVDAALGQRLPLGIGTPGAISAASGLIKNANSTHLNGRPLLADLIEALERPVRIANDADCFALSEAADGAGAGFDCVFGVIIGTGTGAGVVVNGRLLAGPNAIAGEWGHNPLPWADERDDPAAACYCGKTGCIETYLCGAGLVRTHQRVGGAEVDASEVASSAARGDELACAALDGYAERLAKALASIINVLDPDVIVLGGGLSNIGALYSMVPQRWARYVFSDRVDTRLVPAVHGDSSGVRGAARLWPAMGAS